MTRKGFRVIHGRSGFTLVELLIAILILSMMMTIGYSAIRNILRSKQILDDGRDARFLADAVLLRLVREIQLASNKSGSLLSCDKGTLSTAAVTMDGQTSNSANGSRGDSLSFLALDGGQYIPDGSTNSGLVQLRYFVAETPPDDPTKGGPLTLVREEIPYTRPNDKACAQAMRFPLTNRITELRFEYYDQDKDQWSSTWNGSTLPALIRLGLGISSPSGRISNYSTIIPLHSS